MHMKSIPDYRSFILLMLVFMLLIGVTSFLVSNYNTSQGFIYILMIALFIMSVGYVWLLRQYYFSRYLFILDLEHHVIKLKKPLGKKKIFNLMDLTELKPEMANGVQVGIWLSFGTEGEFLLNDLLNSNYKDLEVQLKEFRKNAYDKNR